MLGIALVLAIALISFKEEALSNTGTLGAILLGLVILFFSGWTWFLLLVLFFFSSSALTKYKSSGKSEVVAEFSKGGVRDFWQVLANGAIAAFLSALNYFYPSPLLFVAFLGVIATVNGDTWATELGILSRRKPRLITSWREASVGASGAVSFFGTFAAVAGSFLIAFAALVLLYFEKAVLVNILLIPIVVVAGLAGTLFDSFLGATVQGVYYCRKCGKETERRIHKCGTPANRLRGFLWLDNDLVNMFSSAFGGVVSALLYLILLS